MTIANLYNSRKETSDLIKTDIQQYVGTSSPFLPKSYLGALASALAGRSYDYTFLLQEIVKQAFPQTATGDFLKNFADLVNIPRLQSSIATGIIVAMGADGVTITDSAQLSSQSGNIYDVTNQLYTSIINLQIESLTLNGQTVTAVLTSNSTLATGQTITISGAPSAEYNGFFKIVVVSPNVFTYDIVGSPTSPVIGSFLASFSGAFVEVYSDEEGLIQNLENGAQLSFSPTIDGIEIIAIVSITGIKGGTDLEDIESWRRRILFRYQNPHALFNKAQIESVMSSIAGVTRRWVFEITPSVGFVSCYFTRDNDTDSILPSPTEVDVVKNALLAIKPAELPSYQVIVSAPQPVLVDFVFQSITPNTPEMKNAIIATLNFLFRDYQINVSENVHAITYNSAIINTIDSRSQKLTNFLLTSPTTDIAITAGQLAVLNSITFLT